MHGSHAAAVHKTRQETGQKGATKGPCTVNWEPRFGRIFYKVLGK